MFKKPFTPSYLTLSLIVLGMGLATSTQAAWLNNNLRNGL